MTLAAISEADRGEGARHEPFHYFCRSVHSSSSILKFSSVPVPVPARAVPVPVHRSVQKFYRKSKILGKFQGFFKIKVDFFPSYYLLLI